MNKFEDYHEDFGALLDEYMPKKENLELKRKVTGTIVSIDRTFTYLEVAGEPRAVRVRTEELVGYNLGDNVEVLVITEIEEDDSLVLIASKKRIDQEIGFEKLNEICNNNETVTGKIVKRVNGGYVVELFMVQGFLPNSLSNISINDGDSFVGKEIEVAVKEIKEDKKGKKILLSRKDILAAKELEAISKLAVGDIHKVTVSDILPFGLVVDLDGLRGFIHISEVDWKKTTDLTALFKVGDVIEAKVSEIDAAKRNVKFSIKALTKNPWETFLETHKAGEEITGKVTKIAKYGAFVEVVPGVEGLIHSSDFSWTAKNVHINNYVKVDDEVKVAILELIPAERRLKLGIKQLSANPWETIESTHPVGTITTGKVVEVKPFGIFVQVEDGVDIFIHNSDFAWVGSPKYSKADTIEFKIIDINTEEKRIKGSIKELTTSPWDIVVENYKVGDVVKKQIKTIKEFGLFIKLEDGVDGFIPAQLASANFVKDLNSEFNVGDEVEAEIVEIDSEKKKVKLSIKKIQLDQHKNDEKELLEKYGVSKSDE